MFIIYCEDIEEWVLDKVLVPISIVLKGRVEYFYNNVSGERLIMLEYISLW
ncbi:hypothetical protein BB14905_10215 [Bacillus sp. B14905]|nr:hypothetical protein BB14905_10215 [Bacillus sp. B14905]